MLRFYWFTCHSWELIAKAGLEGLSISPSMLHDFKIREMLNLSMASEGPTGPVLRVAITECRAGCVSIFSAKITHKFEVRFMKAIFLHLMKTKRSLMCSVVEVLITVHIHMQWLNDFPYPQIKLSLAFQTLFILLQ